MTRRFVLAVAAAVLLAPTVALAAPQSLLAEARVGGTTIEFAPQVEFAKAVLTVSTPGGQVLRFEGNGTVPSFGLFDATGQPHPDGAYQWELRLAPRMTPELRKALRAARARGEEGSRDDRVVSGSFAIAGGAFVDPNEREAPYGPTTEKAITPTTAADQVIPDDLIVQGSACVGLDCVNNENFGFDTIRLKENNLRIHFDDTSTQVGFPNRDWRLVANDSASGGLNKFSIEDSTGALTPFTIEAGAATNSVFVDSTSRVGLRTATPVLDLHIATSNTPAIRLEQTNAGGFTAQTWDIAGNEANFFVRDVTGGSRLSFRIRPGAPTSSLDISADGDVGVGTASPDAKLHVAGSDGGTDLLVEETNGTAATRTLITARNNGQTRFVIHNSNAVTPAGGGYFFAHFDNGSFVIRPSGGGVGLVMDASGNVTTEGNLTVNGTFANPSSRALKQGFEPVDPQAVLAKLAELPISAWTYTSDIAGRRHVGPTAEDFLAAFGFGSDGKYIYPIDLQGVTMAAVQGLNQKVTELAQERDRLQDQNSELAERLARIEALLAAQR